ATGVAASTPSSIPQEPDEQPATTGAAASIIGPVWWLSAASIDGVEVPPKESIFRRARFQFVDDFGCHHGECRDGLTLVGNDACNDFSSDVVIEASTVTLGTNGESTSGACDDDLTQAFRQVLTGSFDVDIDGGGELVATSADDAIALRFELVDDPFGPTDQDIVVSGRVGEVVYRIAWEGTDPAGGQGGVLEALDTSITAFQRNASGIGIGPDSPLDANLRAVDSGALLYGVAHGEAARVEYESGDQAPTELMLIEAPGGTAWVFADVVENSDDPWSVVSYDAAGDELARLDR
ncbi:MAG: META domain-containing protein, partial [Ilumatobacter sp.]